MVLCNVGINGIMQNYAVLNISYISAKKQNLHIYVAGWERFEGFDTGATCLRPLTVTGSFSIATSFALSKQIHRRQTWFNKVSICFISNHHNIFFPSCSCYIFLTHRWTWTKRRPSWSFAVSIKCSAPSCYVGWRKKWKLSYLRRSGEPLHLCDICLETKQICSGPSKS